MQGVLVGGLLAGLVLNVIDYLLYGVVLAEDMNAAMQALGKGPIGGSAIVWFVILDFLYGIALVWLYAAIRPRFGGGPRTAMYAGLFMWVVLGLLQAIGDSQLGLLPENLYVTGVLVGLVLLPVAAVAGAQVYREFG